MAVKNNINLKTCGVGECMKILDSKWKPIIIYRISKGVNRFNMLLKEVDGINRQMLSKQLRSLDKTGILERKIFPEIPPRVEYSLTPLGKSLLPVLQAMQRWGDKQSGVTKVKVKAESKAAPQQTALF